MEAHSRCVQRLHSCVLALLYSAPAHHRPSPDRPKTSSQSTLDDLPEHGYGRPKTFKSLPVPSTAARFNALYQKRPPCSFRTSSREALSAGRFRYNSLHSRQLSKRRPNLIVLADRKCSTVRFSPTRPAKVLRVPRGEWSHASRLGTDSVSPYLRGDSFFGSFPLALFPGHNAAPNPLDLLPVEPQSPEVRLHQVIP